MYCILCHQQISGYASWEKLFTISSSNNDLLICSICEQKLEPLSGEQCKICSRPFSKLAPHYRKQDICNDCYNWEQQLEWQGLLEKNISIYYYNDFLKEIFSQFKFRGDHEIVKIFTEKIQLTFKQTFNQHNIPVIIPVPLSPERLYERGFNQAYAIASLLGQPTQDILTKTHTEKQSKKKRTDRVAAESPFQLLSSIQTNDYKNKTFLIIDDIYTTGTTVRQIAKALKPLYPKEVMSLTIARS